MDMWHEGLRNFKKFDLKKKFYKKLYSGVFLFSFYAIVDETMCRLSQFNLILKNILFIFLY